MSLFLPQRWRQQPQGPIQPDQSFGPWGFCWSATSDLLLPNAERTGGIDYSIAAGNPRRIGTQSGLALNTVTELSTLGYTEEFAILRNTANVINDNQPFTLFWYGQATKVGPSHTPIFISNIGLGSANTNDIYLRRTLDTLVYQPTFQIGNSAGTIFYSRMPFTMLVNVFYFFVGVFTGTTLRMYSNGVPGPLTSFSGTLTARNELFRLGGRPGSYAGSMGHSLTAGLIKRAMSDAEVLEVSRNPWQLFRPLRRQFVSLPYMSTYARPSRDVANAGWARVG